VLAVSADVNPWESKAFPSIRLHTLSRAFRLVNEVNEYASGPGELEEFEQ